MKCSAALSPCLFFAAALVMLTTGCPGTPPPPPFNMSGTYAGTWQGQTTGGPEGQEILACPLTIELTHNPSVPWPQSYAVSGTVTVDYSCWDLPEWLDAPPPSVIEVGGVLTAEGGLGLVSGGCTTALCAGVGLSGPIVDTDEDGQADVYSGDWGLTILLAGVEPFGTQGTFTLERQ